MTATTARSLATSHLADPGRTTIRRSTRVGLSLVLVGFGMLEAIPWARAAEPVDILVNGGFEQDTEGWTLAAEHRITRGPGQALSGQACLTGEVTEPDTHLSARQTVQLSQANRYRFEISARGTNRTKLVLFMIHGGRRERVASWEKLTPRWQRYTAPLTARVDGPVVLELIAPSSHASPAGQIWVDDVALIETQMPPVVSVSQDEGFNDEPALAATTDGSLIAAWISFRDGRDTLQVACYMPAADGYRPSGTWQIAGAAGTYILGVATVPAGQRVFVLYAAEADRQWDVYAVACGPEGPEQPVRITHDAAIDVNPAGAYRDGTLHVAWESNRNGIRQIFMTDVREGEVGAPQTVSPPEASCYTPSIAALPDGQLSVAWHSFQNGNFDVFLRNRTGGDWQSAVRLTQAPGVDRHAVLFVRGTELWIAYENAQVEEYYVGRTNYRRIVIAKIAGDQLLGLADYRQSPLWQRCEAPSIGFDRSGRLWVAYLRPRLPRAGWDTYVTCYDGHKWLTPQAVSTLKGLDRRPSLVGVGNRWSVFFQGDTMPTSWSDVDLTPTAKSNVFLADLDPGLLPASAEFHWEPLQEPEEPFEAAELRLQRGDDAPTASIQYQGETLRLYYGDLHQHSDVSVCNRLGDQSIEEDYQFSRDINRLDFACSTDHGYNLNHYLWMYTSKLARVNDDPGRFLTFLAEEWTSSFEDTSPEHPFGYYGHRNLILGDTYFPRWWNARNRQTPADVWEDLRKMNADFVHIPHQLADTGNVPTDWNYSDETAQPVAEIFQVRGSYEYKGTPREAGRSVPRPGYFLQDAWARGIVIGVIASPDHGGGYGKACVFAPDLSRKSVLQAIRQRHCFGTTGARIFLDVRVNDHLMGEKLDQLPDGPVTVKISVRCPEPIERVEVCRDNRFVYVQNPTGKQADLTYVDMAPPQQRCYYYVRVIQQDEEIAWSSPVWFAPQD
jgi:hypothetical protein